MSQDEVDRIATVERLMSAVVASHRGDAAATHAAVRSVPPGAWLMGLLTLTESAIELTARTMSVPWDTAADVCQTVLLDALHAADVEPT
jgi:hypothetical protein